MLTLNVVRCKSESARDTTDAVLPLKLMEGREIHPVFSRVGKQLSPTAFSRVGKQVFPSIHADGAFLYDFLYDDVNIIIIIFVCFVLFLSVQHIGKTAPTRRCTLEAKPTWMRW